MESNQHVYQDILEDERPLSKSYKILISLSSADLFFYILFHFMPFMQPKEGKIIIGFFLIFILVNLSILIYNIKRFHLCEKKNTYKIENSQDDVKIYKKIAKFLLTLNIFFGILFLVNSLTLFYKEAFYYSDDSSSKNKKISNKITDNICYNLRNIISLKDGESKNDNSISYFLYLCNFNISSLMISQKNNNNFIKCRYFPNNIKYSNHTIDKNMFLDFIKSKEKGKNGKKSLFDFLTFCDENKINLYFLNSTVKIKNELNSNITIILDNSDNKNKNYFTEFYIIFGFAGGIISNLILMFIFGIKIIILFDELNRYHLKRIANHTILSNRLNFLNRVNRFTSRNVSNVYSNNDNNDINSVSTEGSENSVSIGDIHANFENNQNNIFQIIN